MNEQDYARGARTGDGATGIEVRLLGPDDTAPLAAFAERPSVRYVYHPLCHGWDTCHHVELRARLSYVTPEMMAALLAVDTNGVIVAAGWGQPSPDRIDAADVVLVVEERYRRSPVVSELLANLAAEVKAKGFNHIVITAMLQTPEDLSDLRKAGLRVESTSNLGGITEVVSAIE